MNKTVLIIIVVPLVVVAGYFFLKRGYQRPVPEVTAPEEVSSSPTSEVKEVTVVGTEFAFSPSTITVEDGQKVKIIFQNQGGAPHNLVIEGLGISTKTIGEGKTDIIEFTTPSSGTYPIFCSVPGHRAAGMIGSLIVE